jgi:hypothetical protein
MLLSEDYRVFGVAV